MMRMYNPPHPGSLLKEALEELHVSARGFAEHIGVAPSTVTRVLNEKGPMTPEMAVKVSAAIPGPRADTWLAMQAQYDGWQAEKRVSTKGIAMYKFADTALAY